MAVRHELRDFLRSRRDRVHPADASLPVGQRPRRVPGLRREEVAMLAGVSVDYYCRLEQGKDVTPSAEVLDAIARALRLDGHERAHLFDLARPVGSDRRPVSPARLVRPGLQALIDGLQTPAFVLGRRMDVLATNAMARVLLCDFDARPPSERNMARWFFLEPSSRELFLDWELVARDNVASLRMDAGRFPEDEDLSRLIGELTVKSRAFASLWADHDVLRRSHGTKRYHHPVVGELTVFYEALALPDDPDQTLFVYSVEAGSLSAEAMRLLADWSAPAPVDHARS